MYHQNQEEGGYVAEPTNGTPIPIKRPAATPAVAPVAPQLSQGAPAAVPPLAPAVSSPPPPPPTPVPPPPTSPPAPPVTPVGVNPSWTASVQMTDNGEQKAETPASSPIGPPPLGTSAAPDVRPQSPVSRPPVIPTTTPPAPPVTPVEATPTSPDLTIPTTSASQPVPWRPIAIGAIILLVLGAIAYALWWFGIGFGAPYNPQTALVKMRAALAVHPVYHTEGSLGLSLEPVESSRNVPARAELPTRLTRRLISWIPTVQALEPVLDSKTETIPTFPELPRTYGLQFTFQADQANNTQAAASFEFDLTGLGDLVPPTYPTAITLEVRRLGDELYVRLPILALLVDSDSTKWLFFDLAEAAAMAEESGAEPQTLTFEKFTAAVASARRVGFERIGPVRTAHYRVEIDLVKLLTSLEIDPADVGANLTVLEPLAFDWWMGVSDALPYQMTLTGALTSDDFGAVLKLNARTTYSRYDITPTITAPDPGEVSSEGLESLLGTDVTNAPLKARDAQRKSDLLALESALAIYYSDHGRYPSTDGATERTDQPQVLTALVTEGYFQTLPVDPLADQYWYGYKSSDGTEYELTSILETSADPAGVATDGLYLYIIRSSE